MNDEMTILQQALPAFEKWLRNIISDEVSKMLELDRVQRQYTKRYTREETAKILGISCVTLWEWTKQGKINAIKIGKRPMYMEEEINRVRGGIYDTGAKFTERSKNITVEQRTYIMKDDNTGYYKIGVSFNPFHREQTLQSEKPTVSLFYICDRNVEKELHEKYADKRVRGEWFRLTIKDVNDIIVNYNFKRR